MTVSTLPPKPVAAVLEKLGRFSRSGAQWKARCPVHEDSTESLMIREGKDGRALVYCHAGCETSAIMSALGLAMGALFPEVSQPPRENGARAQLPALRRPALVKSYDYTDEHGALVFQSCRFHDAATGKKTFRQRRPDGDGWIWNLDGTRLVLYRLPEIIEAVAAERTVYLVEGEKDADTLAAEGYAATTNPMGAGKWRDEFAEVLRGASVVILPDNDEPGRAHATAIAGSLHAAGATVRVVELPNLPPKGDVSDWLAAGGDLDRLDELVSRTPRWAPAGPPKTRWRLDELWENDAIMRPPPPVVPRVAWAGRSTLFAATEKSGKSTLTGFLSAAVSRGTDFLGERCQKGDVLVVGLEEFIGDAARRLRHFDADPTRIHIVDRLPSDPRERPAALAAHVHDVMPVFAIIDSLIAYTTGTITDASSSAQAGPVVQSLTDVAHTSGVALVIIHHARKTDGRYRDSSAIGGGVDLILEMFMPDEEADPTRRRVRARGRVPVHGWEMRFDGDTYLPVHGLETPIDQRVYDYVRSCPNASMRDVREAVGGRAQEVERAVQLMITDGRLFNHGDVNRMKLQVRPIAQRAMFGDRSDLR